MFPLNAFLFFLSLAVLFLAGGIMVRALTWMGRYLKLSEYVFSFILVAFATSLPELFVGINSAMQGVANISLGNLVGANVLNVTLVIGVSILLAKGLTIDRVITKQDIQMIFSMILFPAFLMLDGILSRLDGALLLFLFGGYVIYPSCCWSCCRYQSDSAPKREARSNAWYFAFDYRGSFYIVFRFVKI